MCGVCDPVDYFTLCGRLNRPLAKHLTGAKAGLPFMVQMTRTPVNLLGCSLESFAIHLESLFEEGMNWKKMRMWHIDHIYPIAAVNVYDDTEVFAACNYRNLRPLWASDNCRKNDSITPEAEQHFKALCDDLRQPWHRWHNPHPCDAYVPRASMTANEILAMGQEAFAKWVADQQQLAAFPVYGDFVPPDNAVHRG
jgi:hypothetical protein